MASKKNLQGFDQRTYNLIKQLQIVKRDYPKRFTDIDEVFLQMLIKREIDADQIDNEKKKCRLSPEYFIEEYIQVKNKFENPDTIPEILRNRVVKDRIKFVLYDIQKDLVSAIFSDDKVISTKSRQIGFTTTTLACCTQLITFNNNKTVLLFSKSENDAKSTLAELKFMVDNLPFFLRRSEYKRNEKELALGNRLNASKIIAQTTGRSSGRSHAATQLICDEADYIMGVEEIFKAASFTITATKGKIVVLSTPNMHGSQFQKMVKGAKNKENGFTLIEGYWQTIPQRDQAWYDEQCSMLNHEKKSIDTELDMKWILPFQTYFDEKRLMSIKNLEPCDIICGSVNQYNKPIINHNYIISVDCQEEGTHFNAIVVFDLDDRVIAAEQETRMNVFDALLALSKEYNNAKIMIERNRGFYLIKKFEENEIEHLLLPNIRYVAKTDKYEFDLDIEGKPNKLGFVTLKNTRSKLLMHLADFVHKAKELPKTFLNEASTFVIKRGKPQGLENDDLLISSGIALLTAAVIEETRVESKIDKKLMYLINSYQGKDLEKNHKKKQQEVKNSIDKNISGMLKTCHAAMGTAQYDRLSQITELEKMFSSNPKGRMSKALGILSGF